MTPTEDDKSEKDQSMDDILASIRRIMLDEQARLQDSPGTAPSAYASPARPPVTNADPVLVLDASMAVRDRSGDRNSVRLPDETVTTGFFDTSPLPLAAMDAEKTPHVSDAIVAETVPPAVTALDVSAPLGDAPDGSPHMLALAAPPSSLGPAPPPILVSSPAIEALIAPAAAAAASASVEALLKQLSEDRLAALAPASSLSSPTIEEVVRAELRPFLKAWLDEHLPSMVERLVRVEITRLIGRSGF